MDGELSNYGAKYSKTFDDKADYYFKIDILSNTKTAKDVVGKILDIQSNPKSKKSKKTIYQEQHVSTRPMVIKGLNYSCNRCDQRWKSNQKEILSLIKRHLCIVHFKSELDAGVEANCKDNICTLCGTSLGGKFAMRKHLINVHKYFDYLLSNDLDDLLTKPQEKPRMKRKRDCSASPEFFQKSKVSRNNGSMENIVEDGLNDDNISAIRNMIEFSDSEDEE